MKRLLSLIVLLFVLSGCTKPKADLVIYNAKIYTVNNKFDIAEAIAIKDGKILAIGSRCL